MNPNHDPHSGKFASKGAGVGGKGAKSATAPGTGMSEKKALFKARVNAVMGLQRSMDQPLHSTSSGVTSHNVPSASPGSKHSTIKGAGSMATKGSFKALKREGNVSVRGGTSKPIVAKTESGFKEVGLKTKFSADALKATLHRVASSSGKNPYRAATIITQRGAFQASVGKKTFTGGSKNSQSLRRPSIGKGFHMTKRG